MRNDKLEGIKGGFARYMDGYTQAYDEDWEETFSLPGEVSADIVNTVIAIRREAFQDGKKAGEFSIQKQLRLLIGAAAADDSEPRD